MLPKINFSKVETIIIEAPTELGDPNRYIRVSYKSGIERTFVIEAEAASDLVAAAVKAGVSITGFDVPNTKVSEPNPASVLSQMLGILPETLEGATRLNFWRNGILKVQIQWGNRHVKMDCPGAVVTDAQLVEFFAAWGWKQVNGNLYFQVSPASLVRL